MLQKLTNKVVTGKEKAWVASVVAFVSTYVAQNGLTASQILTKNGLAALAYAVAAHVLVYLTKNSEVPKPQQEQ